MKELFQNSLKNQTEITDTKSLKMIWLGMRDSNPRCRNQNPKPYHLANPQYLNDYTLQWFELLI